MRTSQRASLLIIAGAALVCCSLAACNSSSAGCPSSAKTLAQYTVAYTVVDGGDTCIVFELADGGAANLPLVSTPSSNTVHLCATGADGGPVSLFLDSTALTSTDQLTFTAGGSQGGVAGSACICPLDISNTVSLTLATGDGGPFGYDQDAGFMPIKSFSGSFNYEFAATASSGVACFCNVPCGAHYTISGTP